MEKKYYLGLIIGVIFILIIPLSVNAGDMESNNNEISGHWGDGNKQTEDPYTSGAPYDIPSYHPQMDAINFGGSQYVAIAFVSEVGYSTLIRTAIFVPGAGWCFAWVDADYDLDQDHPDIQFYIDYRDSDKLKAIVVWQQRLEDEEYGSNDDWDVYGSIIDCSSTPPTIGNSFSISDSNDEHDIYPKVAADSYEDQGQQSVIYLNVVWQNESALFSNRFGVNLWRRYIDNIGTWDDIKNIKSPESYDDDYKEPAIDCLVRNSDMIDLYIVYDKFHQESDPQAFDDYIILEYGPSYRDYISLLYATINQTILGDGSMGWPDVSVIPEVDEQYANGNTVDIVWIQNEDNNDKVKYGRSIQGGQDGTFSYLEIDDDGDSGFDNLRYVAVDSYWVSDTIYRCTVIWTTEYNVYYRIRDCNNNFGSQRDAETSGWVGDYVDVAICENAQSVITHHGTWQRSETAVVYGYDP